MDPSQFPPPNMGGLVDGLAPPGGDVITTGYAGGPLGVARPPTAPGGVGLGALGPPGVPVPPGVQALGGLPLGVAAPGVLPMGVAAPGVLPLGAAAPDVLLAPSAFGPTSLSEAVSHRLDAGALRALAELETSEADAIAQRLEQAGATVRNPSAYVHRAVNNARRRSVGAAPPYGAPQGGMGGYGGAGGAAAAGLLDQNALSALQELPQEQAASILDELASKGAGVRNPSAYVVKAVGNARRQAEGGGGFRSYGGPPGGPRGGGGYHGGGYAQQQQPRAAAPPHGYGAPQQPFGPGGQQLDYPGGHYYEHHAVPTASQPFDTDAAVAAEYANLDQKAVSALQALPALQSTQILLELRRKRGAIRNPSAYVMRATANAAAGANPAAPPPQYAQQYQQPQQYAPQGYHQPGAPQTYHQPGAPQQYHQPAPPAAAGDAASYAAAQQQYAAQYAQQQAYAQPPPASDYAAYASAEAAYEAYAAGQPPAGAAGEPPAAAPIGQPAAAYGQPADSAYATQQQQYAQQYAAQYAQQQSAYPPAPGGAGAGA